MRTFLIAALCVCAIDAHADPDRFAASSVASSTSQLRLDMAPLTPLPVTADGRLGLQSGFDAVPRPTPASTRFALHSELRGSSLTLACGQGADAIFANGFQ